MSNTPNYSFQPSQADNSGSSFNSSGNNDNAPYAGFWWRFLAILIDSIIISVVNFIAGLILGIVLGITLGIMGLPKTMISQVAGLIGFVWGTCLGWLYFALLESSEKQATLGKMICGLQVTDLSGDRISFKRATGRYFSRILSALTLSIGYIMAAFTERKQALHDLIAGTLVLKPSDL